MRPGGEGERFVIARLQDHRFRMSRRFAHFEQGKETVHFFSCVAKQ